MTGSAGAPAPDSVVVSLLVFELDGVRFALPIERVVRTLRAVAITPLPEAPPVVAGVVDLAGVVAPVIDLRVRLGSPSRPLRLTDQLVLAHTGRRQVALIVDAAAGVVAADPSDIAAGSAVLPGLGIVDGALMVEGGLILVHDLGRLLSLDDEAALDLALAGDPSAGRAADVTRHGEADASPDGEAAR